MRGRDCEARVGMSSLGSLFASDFGRPIIALPVDQMCGRCFTHALPPYIAVIGQGNVGKNHVFAQRRHAVVVGLFVGARRHAKIACLGVDGAKLAIGIRLDPGNVIPNGGDFPALLSQALRGNQHGKVGLATGRRERSSHVVFLAPWGFDAQNQHVLGKPARCARACVLASHGGCDAEGETLFAQKSIAAVSGSIGPDFTGLGEMNDVLGFVAGPDNVLLTWLQGRAHCMNTRDELTISAQHVKYSFAHARHHAHVDDHVGRV